MNKFGVWEPISPEDFLKVYTVGPVSCMTLRPRNTFIDDDEMNDYSNERWEMYTFQHHGLHPGLFYYDNPHVSLLCVANINRTSIIARLNIWTIKGQKYYASPYGNDKALCKLIEYCKLMDMKPLFSLKNKEAMPSYKVLGRGVWFKNREHYILPWAFCDDFKYFAKFPTVSFLQECTYGEEYKRSFLINYSNHLQINNNYAFNGFISHLDITTTWRVPQQDYLDLRQRTADEWNSLA